MKKKMGKAAILKRLADENVKYLRLWFTDITGVNKNVEVPESQFKKALDGDIMFDGSSIEGFARIEESDMILWPDLSTLTIFPWKDEKGGTVARIICDIKNPDGSEFAGCPRTILKRQIARIGKQGYCAMVGPEAEFFLFQRDKDGNATIETTDAGGYFDLTPIDRGEEARREIVESLVAIGFEVEAAHHEVAVAQHEIDFRYEDALETADNLCTFRFVVRKTALDFGLHATFMPKPIFGINGSGMHCHVSLFKGEENAFYDAETEHQISDVGLNFIGGLLKNARGFCAVTNPLVNSYKRLVPGYEAPTHIAWSLRNRSPLCRVPARRGSGTRVELRMPDPSCNPYLAIASIIGAGYAGIEEKINPGPPVNKNIYTMSQRERGRLKVGSLPRDLNDAIDALEKSPLMKEVLGSHIYSNYIEAKRAEWQEYIARVHQWEVDRYLTRY